MGSASGRNHQVTRGTFRDRKELLKLKEDKEGRSVLPREPTLGSI